MALFVAVLAELRKLRLMTGYPTHAFTNEMPLAEYQHHTHSNPTIANATVVNAYGGF